MKMRGKHKQGALKVMVHLIRSSRAGKWWQKINKTVGEKMKFSFVRMCTFAVFRDVNGVFTFFIKNY